MAMGILIMKLKSRFSSRLRVPIGDSHMQLAVSMFNTFIEALFVGYHYQIIGQVG